MGLADQGVVDTRMLPAALHDIQYGNNTLRAPSFEPPNDFGSTEVDGNPEDVGLSKKKRGNACRNHWFVPFSIVELESG